MNFARGHDRSGTLQKALSEAEDKAAKECIERDKHEA